jgi:hypothetical protein
MVLRFGGVLRGIAGLLGPDTHDIYKAADSTRWRGSEPAVVVEHSAWCCVDEMVR